MIKRNLIIGGLSGLLVLSMATPAFAVTGEESNQLPIMTLLKQTVDGVTNRIILVEDHVSEGREGSQKDFGSDDADDGTSQRERIEARREALKETFDKRKAEIKEKLSGKRLAACEKREDRINSLIDKGVEHSRKRLAAIQRVEEGVTKFYDTQNLSSTDYDTAVAKADQAEADAIAAIDTVDSQNFDCEESDNEKPAHTMRDLHEQRREAMQAYRQSIKELIAVVREAFTAKKAGAE